MPVPAPAPLQLDMFQLDMFQKYWRCEHHPCAIENFFSGCSPCIHGCLNTELRWHDNGFNQQPAGENT